MRENDDKKLFIGNARILVVNKLRLKNNKQILNKNNKSNFVKNNLVWVGFNITTFMSLLNPDALYLL